MVDEPLEGVKPARSADQARVQADRHHLRRPFALGVENVEGIARVLEERLAPVEARRGREPVVVDVGGV